SLLIISFIGFIIRIFNLKYYFPNIEFRRPSIPRSFWVIYIGFSNIFGFSNGFVFSVIAWHLIKYLLIFMQVKKEVYWPLDLWLVNSKYFQIKNDYWLKVKEINVFRDKWSQHLFEGQKLLNTKEQALLWCDEYQYLAATNNNDDASQRLEDLSLVLPKLPQQIVQDIENYEIDNQTMILDWKRLNQEKLSFGDIYNYKGKTLLPPEPSKNWTYKPYSIYGFVFMPLVIFAFISSFSNIHKKQLLNNENDLSKKGVLNEIKQPKRDSVQIAIDVNESSKSNTQVYPLEVEERFLMEDGSYQIGRKLSYTSNSASSVVEKFLTDKNKGVYKTGAKLRYTSTSPSVMQMLFAVDNGLYKSGSTLHVISVYRGRYPEGILNSYGSHPNGRIDVTVKNNPNTSSIVLFLASREPVNWNINPQNGVKIKKIMLSSFENRSKVIGVDNVQVVITSPFPHPYEQQQIPTLDDLAENIKNAIGAKSFTAQGGYDGVKFETY
ncbi:MAG: hypothetical protein KDI39_18015, partial [Pseudomonadales bacterium]|nr:hypothetical protein [Pseudomonadales bacterium]